MRVDQRKGDQQRTGKAQIHAHAAELTNGGHRHQAVNARRVIRQTRAFIRHFIDLLSIAAKDRRQALSIHQEGRLHQHKRRQSREQMADGDFPLHEKHKQQGEQERRLKLRRRSQPPQHAAPDRMDAQQQRQSPERQRGEHRVALRPAAAVHQHRRREHTGKHRAHRRARLGVPGERQLQNGQRCRRLADHVNQFDGVQLRKVFQPGNQRHHNKVAARPCAVFPRHRRAEVIVPHLLQHRRKHLAHASRLDIQHCQVRRHRQHRQHRRAQQHHHRLLFQRAPRAKGQERHAGRADQRNRGRAFHSGAVLHFQRKKHEHRRHAQQQLGQAMRPRFHPGAQRVAHHIVIHHAFTSARAASAFSSFRLL